MSTKELPTITSDGIAKIRTYLLGQVKKTPVGVKVKHSEEDTNSYSKSSDEYTTADGTISIYLKQNEKAYEFNAKKKGARIPLGAEQALATAAALNPFIAGKTSKPAKKR